MLSAEFAITDETLIKILDIYKSSRGNVVAFIPVLAMIRIIFGYVRNYSASQFLDIAKDIFVCTALIYSFGHFVEFILVLPKIILSALGIKESTINVNSDPIGIFDNQFAVFIQMFTVVSYWLCSIIYYVSIYFLTILSSYIIMTFVMLGLYTGLLTYFGVVIFVGLFPVFWQLINSVSEQLLVDTYFFSMRNNIIIASGLLFKMFISGLGFKKVFYDTIGKVIVSHSKGLLKSAVNLGSAAKITAAAPLKAAKLTGIVSKSFGMSGNQPNKGINTHSINNKLKNANLNKNSINNGSHSNHSLNVNQNLDNNQKFNNNIEAKIHQSSQNPNQSTFNERINHSVDLKPHVTNSNRSSNSVNSQINGQLQTQKQVITNQNNHKMSNQKIQNVTKRKMSVQNQNLKKV